MKNINDIANYQHSSKDVQVFPLNKKGEYYTILVCFYALVLVAAQVMGHRMISVFGITEPGGIFIFPLTYTICDVITEIYGLSEAKKAIYYAVAAQALFTILTVSITYMPQPVDWHDNDTYQKVFNHSGMVFLSNITAALISFIYNAKIMHKLKAKFKGMRFSLRSFISTTIGEMMSTGVIVAISFGFTMAPADAFQLFINMMVFKVLYAIVAMFPACYVVSLLKNKELAFMNNQGSGELAQVIPIKLASKKLISG